jgi:hypothetical protein
MSGFCIVTPSPVLSWVAAITGLVLMFSWVIGLAGIWVSGLRPFYWALLLMIPLAFVIQSELLARHVFSCDGP